MSSRAERNVVAILCLSESLGKTLREHYKKDGRRSRVLERYLKELDAAVDGAARIWADSVDVAGHRGIERHLNDFHATGLSVDRDIRVLTSICLGLQSDVYDAIRDPNRRCALDLLMHCTNRIHLYFDRRRNRHDLYERADAAIRAWYALAA